MLTERYDLPITSGKATDVDENGDPIASPTYLLLHEYVNMNPRLRGNRAAAREKLITIFNGVVRRQSWWPGSGCNYTDCKLLAEYLMILIEESIENGGYEVDGEFVENPVESCQHAIRIGTQRLQWFYQKVFRSPERTREYDRWRKRLAASQEAADIDDGMTDDEIEQALFEEHRQHNADRSAQLASYSPVISTGISTDAFTDRVEAQANEFAFPLCDPNDPESKPTFLLDLAAELFTGAKAHYYDVLVTKFNLERDPFIEELDTLDKRLTYLNSTGLTSYNNRGALQKAEEAAVKRIGDELKKRFSTEQLLDIIENSSDLVQTGTEGYDEYDRPGMSIRDLAEQVDPDQDGGRFDPAYQIHNDLFGWQSWSYGEERDR